MNVLDKIEKQGIKERQEQSQKRKAERKEFKKTTASKRGKRNKRKGYECEKKFERMLSEFGFKRVPLSGALGGGNDTLTGDIRREEGIIKHFEVKRRTNGCKTLRKWLEQNNADALLIDTGGRDIPLVVMSVDTLKLYLAKEEQK